MVDLTEAYIKSLAFNDAAFVNAKKLVAGNKIIGTYITKEEDLIFGECLGSGKSTYKTSVDFKNPEEVVFRCSCPSRQIPCKHATALLYQYFSNPSLFKEGEVPEEIQSKREKIEKKVQKKRTEVDKPKKVNISALVKKMKAQLQGVELIEQFISECLMGGIATITAAQIKAYKTGLVKELGNYYLPDYQNKVEYILQQLEYALRAEEDYKMVYYKRIIKFLAQLQALTKLSKATLETAIEQKKAVDEQSAYAFTKMGYIWKLEELKNLGFNKEDGQLVQLGFYDYRDEEQKAYIDQGYYLNLGEDTIYTTMNIRPYKLVKRLKEEDTQFEMILTPQFVVYPGEMNKRIRWEGYTTQQITKEHLVQIRKQAKRDYKVVLKEVKSQLKDTLAEKNPVVLVHYKEIVQLGENFAIRDENNEMIALAHAKSAGTNDTLLALQCLLDKEELKDQVMLGIFEYRPEDNKLIMQPISVITQSEIKRLLG